ncbi:MAG: hypothetical protein ABSD50_10480 [Smithella sp.]
MKTRHGLFLFILAALLMTAGIGNSWPIKSDEKVQNAKKIVTKHIMELAEKDHYFDSSFVNAYVDGLMNSINQNNGQGIIIAHDARRWCKFTFTLDNDENIRSIEVKRYQKDFNETFKKYKIDQSEWLNLIRQFNTLGYEVTTTADGRLKYYYDFAKDSFMATITSHNKDSRPPQAMISNDNARLDTATSQTIPSAQTLEPPKIIKEQSGNITNYRVEGSLASTQTIGCIPLSEVKNTFTPADLYKGVSECIAKDNYDLGAGLFALAGIYASFDAERITDKTAGQAKTVLIMNVFSSVSQDKKTKFSEEIDRISKDPDILGMLCSQVQKIGMPNYYPSYMILHGIKAFTGNPHDGALAKDFDAQKVWMSLQTNYLHCTASKPVPTLSASIDTSFASNSKLQDKNSMQEIKRLHVKGFINAIAWNKDGSRLAALSLYGSTITVWETKNWGIINEFRRAGGSYSNNSFAFLPDGSLITAAPLGDYRKDPDSVNLPSPFNKYETLEIFSLIQWNPETGVPVRYIPDLGFPPKDVSLKVTNTFALSRDGSLIAAIHADDVLLYETSHSSLVRKFLIPRISTAKFIWSKYHRKPLPFPSSFADSSHSLAFSPDGKELAIGTLFGMVYFFSIKDGTLRSSLEAYPGGLFMCNAIAYSSDGIFIATGKAYSSNLWESDNITTDVWRVSDHKKIASLEGDIETHAGVEMPSHVRSLSWSPKGDTLVVADEGSLRIWQISESDQKLLFVQKLRGINSTGYSPQGILAVTSHNEIIILH